MNDYFLRRLTLRAATLNVEERSVEAIIATENRVTAYSQVDRDTVDEVLLMSGAQVPDQIPLLDSHDSSSTDSCLGSIRSIRIDGRLMIGRVHFADDPLSERAWKLVRDGHLRDFSSGNEPLETHIVEPGYTAEFDGHTFEAKRRRLYVRTSWRPREASLVIVGADSESTVRSAAPLASIFRTTSIADFILGRMVEIHAAGGPHVMKLCDSIASRSGFSFDTVSDVVLGQTDLRDEQLRQVFADVLKVESAELAELPFVKRNSNDLFNNSVAPGELQYGRLPEIRG